MSQMKVFSELIWSTRYTGMAHSKQWATSTQCWIEALRFTFKSADRMQQRDAESLFFFPFRFHEVEPQRDLRTGTVGRLSRKVVAPTKGAVPYPHLSDNTIVLSDVLLLAPVDGKLYLHIRPVTVQLHSPLGCMQAQPIACFILHSSAITVPRPSVWQSKILKAMRSLSIGI